MSRKSKRNRPTAPPTAAAVATVAGKPPASRTGVIVAVLIGIATLVIAVVIGMKLNSAPDPRANAKDRTALASAEAPTAGPADARVHIVEFLDPACETCADFYPHVKRMMAANPGKIRLSVRHVAFHKGADEAVRILQAARAQDRYWPALEALLSRQGDWVVDHRVRPERIGDALAGAGLDPERLRQDLAAPDVARRIEQDMADARTLAVTQTPEYFVNGRQMASFGLEQLQQLVYDELRRAYP
jgi:protein-disulfide isomerase